MITVTLGDAEAIYTVSAIETQVEKYRAFCRERDQEFGSMNNIYKGSIAELIGAHKTLVEALRANGYPMTLSGIPEDPVDEIIKD